MRMLSGKYAILFHVSARYHIIIIFENAADINILLHFKEIARCTILMKNVRVTFFYLKFKLKQKYSIANLCKHTYVISFILNF